MDEKAEGWAKGLSETPLLCSLESRKFNRPRFGMDAALWAVDTGR